MRCHAVSLLIAIGSLAALSACGTEHAFERGKAGAAGNLPSSPVSPGAGLNFSDVVKPELQRCVSCHAGGAGNWTYDGGDMAYAQVVGQVNLDAPSSSPLLLKGTNRSSHGGGAQFSEASDAYLAILTWIEEGAAENQD